MIGITDDMPTGQSRLKELADAAGVVPQPAPPNGVEAVRNNHNGKPLRLALTLAGGGARGYAHIGVLKVPEEEGIKPDLIAASSTGALIGSLYCAGLSVKQIEYLARAGKMAKAFLPRSKYLQAMGYLLRYVGMRLLGLRPKIGLYSGKSIARFVERNVPNGVRTFKDLKIPLAVTSVNLIDTRQQWLTEGNIGQAVQASCTLPFMYRPVTNDGKLLVDGATRETLPTEMAQASGAPVVVAVKLHSFLEKMPARKINMSTFAYADRVSEILMSEIESKAVASADVLIEPRIDSQMREFDEVSASIAAGEEATRKVLPEIRRRLNIQAPQSAEARGQNM